MKKNLDPKEPVKLRTKELTNGNISLYLDIYQDGKRKYEFLKLYLAPETGKDRKEVARRNAETLQLANTIKSKRIVQLQNDSAGVFNKANRKMLLTDWLDKFAEYKKGVSRSMSYYQNVVKVKKHVVAYRGGNTTMGEVDKKFVEGFIDYLRHAKGFRNGKQLSQQSMLDYFSVFNSAMRKAVRDGILTSNPIDTVSSDMRIKQPESERVYLTIDEVGKMMDTPCKREDVKRAFMFSCFTGLRISDIRNLSWGDIDIQKSDGQTVYKLTVLMQKTQRYVAYTLSNEAVRWLPDKSDSETVFYSLPMACSLSICIKDWARNAGITKNVSFHTARHTFATMMLTLGADIYTTSKLLGHTKIATTEIYAKIVDKKKDEAMGLIDQFFNKK